MTPRSAFAFRLFCLAQLSIFLLSGVAAFSQESINALNSPVTQNFDSLGSSAAAALPNAWKIGTDWSSGAAATTVAYGTSGAGIVAGTSSGGTVNWANGVTATSTERSLGFLTTGTFSSPRSIIYAFQNNTGGTVTSIVLAWNYEKYRSGSRAFSWTFFHGDTTSATVAETAGNESYVADANNTTVSNPPASTSKSVIISGLNIPNGSVYYLRWTYAGTGGSSNAQGLGIDDFTITLSGSTSPAITSFSPTSGLVGDSVTINGANFGANPTVKFNGVTASSTVNPAGTQIATAVPADATTGKITVEVTGQTTATSAGDFAVLAPGTPIIKLSTNSINGLGTSTGSPSAATNYTVTGTNLGSTAVTITPDSPLLQIGTNGTDFASSASLAPSGGVVSNAVFLRVVGTNVATTFTSVVSHVSGAASNALTVSGSITNPAPSLVLNPTNLLGFATATNTPSTNQTFTVVGSNLTTDVSIIAPSGFEVANDAATWGTNTSLVQTGGSASGTISVRMSALSVTGPRFGSVFVGSSGVTNRVSVNGSVPVPNVPGQIYWNFDTETPTSGTGGDYSSWTFPAITQNNNNGTTALLTTTSASLGYTNPFNVLASGTTNAGASARVGGLDVSTNAFFEVQIVVPTSTSASITNISFGSRSTGTGPAAYSIRSSVDGFASDVVTNALTTNSIWTMYVAPVSIVLSNGTNTIRIYGYGSTAASSTAGTANWRIDDLTLAIRSDPNAPAINVAPSSITNFTAIQGSESASRQLTVTGNNLGGSNITVTSSNNFYVISTNQFFTAGVNSLTLAPTGGNVEIRISTNAPVTTNLVGNLALSGGGATNNVTLRGTVTDPNVPSLAVNPTGLAGFSTTVGTASSAQTFAITAANLGSDVVIAPPAGFAVSTNGTTFSSTALTIPVAQFVSPTTLSVRLTGAVLGSPSGNVAVSSGALTANVSVSGTVTAAPSSSLTITGALSNFTTAQGVTSVAQSFVVQGSGLTSNVTISAPANLQFTTNTNGPASYAPSIVLPIASGALSNTVFARIPDTAAIGGPTTNVITASSGVTNATLSAVTTVSSNTSPFIVANPSSLSGFSTTEGTPSANQTLKVAATNLTSGPLSVAASSNYEVSLDGINFSAAVNLNPVAPAGVIASNSGPVTYNDATNDIASGISTGGGTLDIVRMEVSDTATDLVFNLTLNGNTTTPNDWGNFMIGIANGRSAGTTNAAGNGWNRPINMITPTNGGMTHWIGSWVNGPTGGAQLWSYNGTAWQEQTATPPAFLRSAGTQTLLTYTVPLASLGLAVGDTLFFDAYSSGSGASDSAVDALSNPSNSITAWGGPYTSSTNTGISSYRVGGSGGGGNVAETTVHVRLRGAAATNPADGAVTLSGGGAAPKTVALNGAVLARPVITPASTMTQFVADLGANSGAQPFTFAGTNLVGGVTVTAPTGYEVSKTTNGTYASTLTYVVAEAQPGPATNWVRLATNAPAGIVSGNIALASQGAVTTNVAVTGRVTGNPVISVSPTNLTNFFAASGTNSDAQTFIVRGVDLDGPIVLTATNANSWEIRDPADGVYKTSVTLAASNAVPVTFARDSSSNAAYAGGWTNNSDGGNGFGPWAIQAAGSATATIGNPADAGITGMSSNSFALQGTNSYVTAQRRLDAPLLPGDTLSLQFGNNFDTGGPGNKGVNIFAGGFDPANQLLNINMGNSATITINGQPMFAQYGTAAVTLNLQYVAPGQLRVFGTGRNGTETFDQTFAVAAAPDGLSLYAGDLAADQVAQRVLYANDFAITSGSVGPAVDPTEILVRIKTGAPINPALTGLVDATSTGAAPAAVALSGIVSSTPEITQTSSLASFSALLGFPSDPQTFAVGGNNLDAAGVLVTPPAGYEVSLDGIAWSPTVTVPRTGLVTPQRNVSIRIAAAGSAGPRNGNIALSSTGATGVSIPVTGQVNTNPGPQLQATPISLSGLTATQGTAGTAQNFTLAGQGITMPVQLTAPTGFEISTDGGTSFGPTRTFTPPPSGSFAQPVAVRLTAGAAVGIYAGNIAVSSGATSVSVALSGAVFSGSGAGVIVNPADLFGFETREGTASDSQSFVAVGRNLSGNVTLSVTNDYFEITTDPADPASWGDQAVLVPVAGVLPATTIHVRIGAVSAFGDVVGEVNLRDTSGNLAQVVVSGFIERLQPPEVRMIKPDQNVTFTRIDPGVAYELAATASATAVDGNGAPVAITQVEFLVDGVPVGADTTKPYALPYTFVFEGDFDVTARATDALGNVGVSGVAKVEVRAPLPGELIESFVPPAANATVRALAGDTSGRVYLGGDFTQLTSADDKIYPEPHLARLTLTGAVDTTFKTGAGPNARVRSILVVADGVILGGDFTEVNGASRVALAKVTAGGAVDTSFNATIAASTTANPSYVQAIVQQPDGKILIGGSFAAFGGVARANLARLNANGTLDTSFNAPVSGLVNTIALQSDGKILIGGSFSAVHGVTSRRIARLNADGTRDATFNVGTGTSSGFESTVQSIAVTPLGKVYVAGSFTSYKGNPWWRYLAQLDQTGNIVSSFNYLQGLDFPASRVLVVPGTEDVLVAGQFTSASNRLLWVGADPVGRIGRFKSDGSISAEFNPGQPGANGAVTDAVQLPGGGWLIAGSFTKFNNVDRSGLALLAGPQKSTSYAGWAAEWGLSGAEAHPDAKLNGAGVPNLLVYAMRGSDPRSAQADLAALPQIGARTARSSGLSLAMSRNAEAKDVRFTGEYSEDLKTWSTNGVVTEFLSDGTVLLQAPPPSTLSGHQFLRLKVVLP